MKLITGAIGNGKTHRLLRISTKKQIPILVKSEQQKQEYKDMAKKLGYINFPEPIIGKISLALSTHNESDFSKKVIVDNLEQHLNFIDTASFCILNNNDIQIIKRNGNEMLDNKTSNQIENSLPLGIEKLRETPRPLYDFKFCLGYFVNEETKSINYSNKLIESIRVLNENCVNLELNSTSPTGDNLEIKDSFSTKLKLNLIETISNDVKKAITSLKKEITYNSINLYIFEIDRNNKNYSDCVFELSNIKFDSMDLCFGDFKDKNQNKLDLTLKSSLSFIELQNIKNNFNILGLI